MNPKIAISILLVITSLSVLTVLMLLANNGFQDKSLTIEFDDNKKVDSTTKTVVKETIPEKDYTQYDFPEIEKQKDEARARLKRLEELRASIDN